MGRRLLNILAAASLSAAGSSFLNYRLMSAAGYPSMREAAPRWATASARLLAPPAWSVGRPGLRVRRRSEQAARLAAGICPACGYDLRASPGRCPECGAVPKGSAPTAGGPA